MAASDWPLMTESLLLNTPTGCSHMFDDYMPTAYRWPLAISRIANYRLLGRRLLAASQTTRCSILAADFWTPTSGRRLLTACYRPPSASHVLPSAY